MIKTIGSCTTSFLSLRVRIRSCLNVLCVDIGQSYGADVRDEIKKYGKEGTGKKYLELQNARGEMIMR